MKRSVSRARTVARLLLSIGAGLAAAIFLYRQRGLVTGFRDAAAEADWYWIGIAFAALMLSLAPLAQAERMVLRIAGVDAPLGEMTAVAFASNAIASSVPAGAAVAQGYAFKRYKHFGATDGEAAWAELSSGAIAFAALAGIALAGSIIDVGRAAPIVIPILGVVFAGAMGAVALFRRPQLLCEVVDWAEARIPTRGRSVAARLSEIADDIGDIRPPVRTWISAYVLSTLNWLFDVASLAITFVAFGAAIPWGAIFLAFAGTKIISSIGVTPGGIGLAEGGMAAIFVAYQVDAGTAAAVTVVYRAMTLVGLVGFGWVLVGVLSSQGRHPHERVARR